MDGQDSSIEFLQHPSYRQIATFFLGFVFISSIHFAAHVPLAAARRLRLVLLGRRANHYGGVGLEANRTPSGDDKVNRWLRRNPSSVSTSLLSKPESNNIALSLTVCFAMTSVAHFGTLLIFPADGGGAGCAFLVAWGGMAGQAARLLGLLKLSLDLRKMGVRRWETFAFWVWLVFALVVMFVSNAIGIGVMKPINSQSLPNAAVCYRKHILGTAVVSSVVDVLMESYCLIRIPFLIVPAFLSTPHKADALFDVRFARALSLLILDIATAAPAARFFGVLTDFIPWSIGALLVLAAFNYRSPDVSIASTMSIPATRPDSLHSRSTIEIKKIPSTRSLAGPQQRISHPFAASALQDPAPETEDWPESASPEDPEKQPTYPEPAAAAPRRSRRQTWRTSNHSTVSESDSDVARSVKGAVVAFAFKDLVGQGRKARDRRSFLPAMPTMPERPSDGPSTVLPRSTPLRIPRPVVAPQAPYLEALERRLERDREVPTTPSPRISITSATPVDLKSKFSSASSRPMSSTTPPTQQSSNRPSISVMVPDASDDSTRSLHLTPITPAHPHSQQSRRGSSESNLTGEWRSDSRHDSYGSHPSSDEASSSQAHRASAGSSRLPPADDDLSIVYEASHEDSDSLPPSRAYRPTFGEHMFVEGGIGRPTTPVVGVPEDVGEGGLSHGSPTSSGGSKPSSDSSKP